MTPPYALTVDGTQTDIPIGKMIALGGNYVHHVREMGGDDTAPPVLFLKPASALVLNGGTVYRPPFSLQLHHELELVVVIGRRGARIAAEDAAQHVFGYAVGLDMTLRDVQAEAKRRGHPWAIAKGFDTSAPISPVIPADRVSNPEDLEIELRVNGEVRQHARIADMSLPIPGAIAYASQAFTLDPGDLIFTGTPKGIGPVFPGDRLRAELVGHTQVEVRVAELEPTQAIED